MAFDPSKSEKLVPKAGAGGTEFLLREVVSDQPAEAWGVLSEKCMHYLKTRFGRSSFPKGIEFGDFASDVMLKILTSIESFEYRGKDSFWRWVQTLAGNLWRDQWRKHMRDKKLGLLGRGESQSAERGAGALSVLESAQSKEDTPTQVVRFHELAEAEAECVSRLSDHMREVYVMRRQHELTFAEIAAQTGGTNEATLRSHYMRARDKVRECLGVQIDALGSKIQGWQ